MPKAKVLPFGQMDLHSFSADATAKAEEMHVTFQLRVAFWAKMQ